MKKIVFLSGTRADYGKLKSLMKKVDESYKLELHIFVTGMHMLSKYGSTWKEIEKDGFKNIYKFINQQKDLQMDMSLSNTIIGFSNYVKELNPDLIVIHGDRLEALAGAIVGAFNNIRVIHIEGGEVSGTIDESIRHAISKFSHIHLVSNEEAKKRVVQLGESEQNIFVIGSPDLDIMQSSNLPDLELVKSYYDIDFEEYSLMMYHPVTTEIGKLQKNVECLVDSVIASQKNYIIIYPNNDEGSSIILDEYKRLDNLPNFKIYPSIKFEYFLTLLKNADFIIGNSSAGIMEAGAYGIPAIDIGTRQKNRYNATNSKHVLHVNENKMKILQAIEEAHYLNLEPYSLFGNGNSDELFLNIIENDEIYKLDIQKNFIDVDY